MTAVPLPKTSNVLEDGKPSSLFPVKEITKTLLKEYDTPQVNKMISRLSTEAYISSSEYMQVFVRVRPFSAQELQSKEDQNCMEISDNSHSLTLNPPKESNKFKSNARGVGDSKCKYSFTKVFSAETGQKEFFEGTALKIVENFLGGQNSLIFTYGVTSSGKTYTMQGEPGNEGIMPRSVDLIFNSIRDQVLKNSKLHLHNVNSVTILDENQHLQMEMQKQEVLALADVYEQVNTSGDEQPIVGETSVSSSICDENSGISTGNSTLNETKRSSKRFIIFVSFIEIYKECIYDLFEPVLKGKKAKRTPLQMEENKGLPIVKNVREIQVCSREEIFKLLAIGQRNLHMAETNLNHNSSRSHFIFTIKTVCTTDSGSDILNTARVSQLSFCDLAGSERCGKTNSFGERLKEAGKITTSMLTLGKCIEAARHNQQHGSSNPRMVPFRESRLTRLFQSVLQGHGRACMLVNINQCASMFDETAHALKFSAIASEIIERPRVAKSFRASKRPASMNHKCPIRPKHFTIGWEPTQTPIKERDETVEAEELEAAAAEEEECSSEEEHDEEYWLERESKSFKAFGLVKHALKQKKENVIAVEKRIREECAEEMRRYIVNMEEEYEERLKREVRKVENEGEKKYTDAVNFANNMTKELHEKKKELEKKVESLEEDIEALENKLDTEVEQNKTKQTEIDSLKEALASKEKEMSILAKSKHLNGETKETDGSSSSADVSELEEQIKCPQKETDEDDQTPSVRINRNLHEYVTYLIDDGKKKNELKVVARPKHGIPRCRSSSGSPLRLSPSPSRRRSPSCSPRHSSSSRSPLRLSPSETLTNPSPFSPRPHGPSQPNPHLLKWLNNAPPAPLPTQPDEILKLIFESRRHPIDKSRSLDANGNFQKKDPITLSWPRMTQYFYRKEHHLEITCCGVVQRKAGGLVAHIQRRHPM